MINNDDINIGEFAKAVAKDLNNNQTSPDKGFMQLNHVEIETSFTAKKEANGEIKMLVAKGGAIIEESKTHKITLKFTPVPKGILVSTEPEPPTDENKSFNQPVFGLIKLD